MVSGSTPANGRGCASGPARPASGARSSAVRAADPVIDSSRLYSCSGAATPFGVARTTSVPAAVRIWYGSMSSSAQKPAGSVLPSFMVHFAAPVSADLDLRKLRYFLAVAHHLNFGRAAEELLLAQPALSRAIQALETDFGVTLFERDHHKVALTPPGAALVREAETLLARAAAARRRIQAASRPASTLTVGFRPGIIITDAVQQFTRDHPETAVNAIRIEWDEHMPQSPTAASTSRGFAPPSPVPTSWLPRFSMTRKWSLSRLPTASPAAIPSAWLTWPASRCCATTPRPGTRQGTRLRNAGSGPWRKSSRLSRWATASL